jgi:hypothetical protein
MNLIKDLREQLKVKIRLLNNTKDETKNEKLEIEIIDLLIKLKSLNNYI